MQSYKIYQCEYCSGCPLKEVYTKAKGDRKVHWNPIFEEMKTKAKTALECDKKAAIYARRKIEVESVFGHIKGNRSFRRYLLRGLEKVHTEFGIVALAHNLLKIASYFQVISKKTQKQEEKKVSFFSSCFIRGTYRTAPLFIRFH